MGNKLSYNSNSITSNFFIKNFKNTDSFILDIEETSVLFTLIKEELISFQVKGEIIFKPHRKSVVLISSHEELSDFTEKKLEFIFDVFYDFEEFFNVRFSQSCYDYHLLINKIEKFILKG